MRSACPPSWRDIQTFVVPVQKANESGMSALVSASGAFLVEAGPYF